MVRDYYREKGVGPLQPSKLAPVHLSGGRNEEAGRGGGISVWTPARLRATAGQALSVLRRFVQASRKISSRSKIKNDGPWMLATPSVFIHFAY